MHLEDQFVNATTYRCFVRSCVGNTDTTFGFSNNDLLSKRRASRMLSPGDCVMFFSSFASGTLSREAAHRYLHIVGHRYLRDGVGSNPTIQARAAGQFVDSMGVNVHLESQHLPYRNYLVINQRLESLGMRHIRDEINRADPSFKDESFVDEIQSAGGLGYKLCGLIEGGNDYPRHGRRLKSDHVVPDD